MDKHNPGNADFYLQATEEYESGDIDDALWAKALAISHGDIKSAMYNYIALRVAQIEIDQSTLSQLPLIDKIEQRLQ